MAKEIQNTEFGYSALLVEVKHFRWNTDWPKKLSHWAALRLSADVEHGVENKGVGGREDTIF